MAHSDGLITKPVNTSDVCSTIGEDKHRIGYLCVSENINIYSKHKPMRVNSLAELTNTQKINANWGYHVPNIAQLRVIIQNIISEDGGAIPSDWTPSASEAPYEYMHYGWWYQRPQGGATSPYRLGDFNGYNHNTSAYIFKVNDIPSTISGAFDVDLSGTINIDDPNDVGSDTTLGHIGSLFNKVLLVGAYKTNQQQWGNLRFKTGPGQSGSSTYYSIVHFSDTDLPLLFKDGVGDYYLYFFLVDRDQFTGGSSGGYLNPMQNLDGTGTYYPINTYAALGDKMNKCISLPIARKVVTYTSTPVVNPLANLTFTFASGGSIVYDSTHRRFNITFPQLTARNTGSSQVIITKANLYMSVFLQKISDSSKRWESAKYTMGLTGTTTVAANGTATVFSSATGTINDTSIVEFLGNDSISDYAMSALVYYNSSGTYYDVKSFSV